jgi:hypothetical protein
MVDGPAHTDVTERNQPMKYVLLIYQGTTPLPSSPDAWATLTEDEQKAV